MTSLKQFNVKDDTHFSLLLIDAHAISPLHSQGYFANVNTRAVIFIEADNPYIGLMCFLAVGMIEVSSCEITINEGQKVQKGQETGIIIIIIICFTEQKSQRL